MKITNSLDPTNQPSVVMLVYGEGGVGKTTFSSTAPKPLLADCEGGSKYFGLRNINIDVAQIQEWKDIKDFLNFIDSDKYETIVVDPIGELMEKLMKFMVAQNNVKLVQRDGNPTMAGWGWLKKTMRLFIKKLRDSNKHVIFIAHLEEKPDNDRLVKRPMIQTKLSQEIVNIVDVVGYMTVLQNSEGVKRVILVDPETDKYIAKDRTGQLGVAIPPDFSKIIEACRGTKAFAWSSDRVQAGLKNNQAKDAKEKTGSQQGKGVDENGVSPKKNSGEKKETKAVRGGVEKA